MPPIQHAVKHKHQSKANDCWYACIQMLRTWKTGSKTKAAGTAAAYLHGGVMGHRLNAVGNRMDDIKKSNNLLAIGDKIDFSDISDIAKWINHYGPLMVGGDFGAPINVPVVQMAIGRMFGHFIVVAGADTGKDRVWIHDPMLWDGKWMSCNRFDSLAWKGIDDSVLVAI
ncbi:MAG: papain-like cysteine protease family protein [Pyrinomonadaceae bacterium]|nr:papain-like cysteine protease family protein [Pyrinomonadaceae bacterium]